MFQYFLFYKPYNVLSQFTTQDDKKTLADYFINVSKDIYPIGRLDYDSEGMLVLTNDKSLTDILLNPKNQHTKTYFVQLEGSVTKDDLSTLLKGVVINVKGKQFNVKATNVNLIKEPLFLPERTPPIRYRKDIPTSWASIEVNEGKNRQIRKMTAAIGFPTLRLVRFSIGKLNIENFQNGEIRQIEKNELKLLTKVYL